MKTMLLTVGVIIIVIAARSSLPKGNTVRFEDLIIDPKVTPGKLLLARAGFALQPSPVVEDMGLWKEARMGDVRLIAIPFGGGWGIAGK